MRRRQLLTGCLLALCGAGARATTATLQVQAVVRRHASVAVVDCSKTLVVKPQDIVRGWVRSPRPVTLAVRANHTDGIGLELLSVREEFLCVEVSGPGMSWAGTPSVARIQLPTARGRLDTALELRFALGAGVTPGIYPWPVGISAAP